MNDLPMNDLLGDTSSAKSATSLSSTILSLDDLIESFELAFEQKNWSRISSLNEMTQPCVEAATQRVLREQKHDAEVSVDEKTSDDANAAMLAAMQTLRPQLESLSRLVNDIQRHCIAERDALGKQLSQFSQSKAGASAYHASAGIIG